jgi:RNA polymerase sigma-70 factor, ECF subfamily
VRNPTTNADVERRLEVLFREEAPRLWRSLLLSTEDPEVANDAVAEAFAQALRRGAELRDPLAWVWRVAFRVAAGEMQSRRSWRELGGDPGYETPEPLFDLIRALRTLTEHQRTAVVLADYAGYSHRQIAGVLGSTTAAVGVHVHRARKRLREMLEEDDEPA